MGGTDLEYQVSVPFWEAIRGGSIKLNIQRPGTNGQMVAEPVEFRIKPGTREGQRIRLAGKGNPGIRGARRAIFTWWCTSIRIRCSAARATTST